MRRQQRILAIVAFLALVGGACSSSSAPEEASNDEAISTTSTAVSPRIEPSPEPSLEPSPESSEPPVMAMSDDELTLEDAMAQAIEEGNNELAEFGERELDDTLSRGERVMALLTGVGEQTLNETDHGQCLVQQFEGFDEAALKEVENFDEVPSADTLVAVGEVNRSCGYVRYSVANFLGGLRSSGGTNDWVDISCLEASFSEDHYALFTLIGNAQALDLPDFIDRGNYAMVGLVSLSHCMNYGEVVDSGHPNSLARSSIDCITDWGHTAEQLERLLSGNMSAEEFDAALSACLTAEEYDSFASSS